MRREPVQVLSIRLPLRVSARLAVISRKRGTTVSAVVREALEAVTQSDRPTAWSLGAHVFGRVRDRLPRDLSSNKKHLRHFGK